MILIESVCQETRSAIRLLLLKVFGALCGLDHVVISILLSSILPRELARDIRNDLNDLQKALYSSLVCVMIFSTGEQPPLELYDQWNDGFIDFLMETIENPPDVDEEDQIADSFTHLVLAFNVHFKDWSANSVMRVLSQRGTAKTFSEKLLMLVNREDDPVAVFTPLCPNSGLKMLHDIFSNKETSGLFFTTDLMVLLDIIVRQLSDLAAGDENRSHYLTLLSGIIRHSNYAEHQHRLSDISGCFQNILQGESNLNEGKSDRQVVLQLYRDFPQLFNFSTSV
jgi:hypothetical protein